MDASTEQPDAPTVTADSRLESIWKDHLKQYRRVDDLEKRIDEHAMRLRRRVVNLLETAPSHRLSHLRLFVSHHDRSAASDALVAAHAAPATTVGSDDAATGMPQKWTLVVEGKLLIGHLDHESAKAFDERLKKEFQQRHNVSADHSSMPLATSQSTSNTVPTEEEDPVKPVKFTHFFDKLVAQFQSVYQPIESPSGGGGGGGSIMTPKASTPKASSSSSKKKSRSVKRQKTAAAAEVEEPEPVDPMLLTYSDPQEFTWNKTITTITNATPGDGRTPGKPAGITTSTTTKDAYAFFGHYESPPPPSAGMKLYGAIATVQLYPSRGPDQRYKPSKDFAKAFFPKHIDVLAPPVLPTTAIAEAKKSDEDQDDDDGSTVTPSKYKKRTPTTPSHQTGPLALENEIHVPTSLTMNDILTSLFTYVQDHKLTAEHDTTMIMNDKKLEGLFKCESMHFHELQTLLMQSKLIMLLPKPAPVSLKYVMKADALPAGVTGEDGEPEILPAPMTMDLHNDVYVPNLFPYRARECLRRIKRRELDYTSSRTKARYLLMASRAKDESAVKNKIEEAICGATLGEWPILACLAKAAPPHSEARKAAQLDSKIAYVLEQVEGSQQAAHQAWDLVDLCRDMGSSPDEASVDDKGSEDDKKPVALKKEQLELGEDAMDVDNSNAAIEGVSSEVAKADDSEETNI